MVLAYVSAIQDISLSPVLMSGAGTSMPGPDQERRAQGSQASPCLSRETNVPPGSRTVRTCRKVRLQLALTNEALLGQLNGEPPGDLLQLIILRHKRGDENTWLLGYSRRK